MDNDKIIFSNTFYQAAGKIIASGLGVVTTFFLARYLGKIGYSEYSFIFGFVGFVSLFPDFGLVPLVIRGIASRIEGEKYFSLAFTLRFIVSLVFFTLSLLVVLFLPYTPIVKTGIVIASISTILLLLSGVIWAVFQARLKFRDMVIAQVSSSVLAVILIILGNIFRFSLLYYVTVSVITAIIGFLISYIRSEYKKLFHFHILSLIVLIKQVLPFTGWVIVSVAYFKIDLLILSLYYNPSYTPDVGLYGLSYKVFEAVIVLGGYFPQTLYPFFSKHMGTSQFKNYFKRYLWYTIGISVFSSLCLYVLSKQFILIFGINFIDAADSLRVLSLASGTTILSGFFLAVAASAHKEKQLLYFGIAALVLNITLDFFYIPKHSFIGASWVTVVTQFFILLSNAFIVFRYFRIEKNQ